MSALLIGLATAAAWIAVSAIIIGTLFRGERRDHHRRRGDWDQLP